MSGGGGAHRRQRRMGPAPFASFEDLSDETESPGETTTVQRLPGIHEDVTPPARLCIAAPPTTTTTTDGLTPTTTPRIDISRASSSSHHEDSRDSTPERELFQTPGETCQRLGLAFKEDGALELRSSTEELDFQDPTDARRSPVTVAVSEPPQMHQRKDSQSSDFGGLLSISGRTSRLSSIGSQGSRVSNASHLSVTSGMSRSPSPHKMLLETSFCGSKNENAKAAGASHGNSTKLVEDELLERVLLSRKHDPTEAILAEGISIECRRKIQASDPLVQLSPVLQHTQQHSPVIEQKEKVVPQEKLVQKQQQQVKEPEKPAPQKPEPPPVRKRQPPPPIPPEKPARKLPPAPKVNTEVIITLDKPTDDVTITLHDISNTTRSDLVSGKTIIADSGIEYTFIPLKGPLPKEASKTNKVSQNSSNKSGTTTGAGSKAAGNNVATVKSKDDPQYIRIKLKPDHMYTDEPVEVHSKPVTLDLSNGGAAQPIPPVNIIHPSSPKVYSNTPSPSVSRKSSFASLFRAKEYGTSPESPTVPQYLGKKKSPRSRSKSSDRERPVAVEGLDKQPSKHRSVFTLFKSKKSCHKSNKSLSAEPSTPKPATSLHSLEFTFDHRPPPPVKKYYEVPLDGDSIIIPLHSPSSEEARTVIETAEEPVPIFNNNSGAGCRQSSTSSENIVFTTNLGSNNEIFTTKLPKCNERTIVVDSAEKKLPTPPPVQLKSSSPTLQSKTTPSPPPTKSRSSPLPLSSSLSPKSFNNNETSIPIEDIPPKSPVQVESVDSEHSEVIDKSAELQDGDIQNERGTNDSSESENENLVKLVMKRNAAIGNDDGSVDSEHERKGLVLQQDSYDDEFPYIPTTLPLERSVAVPIVPVKQRSTFEIKTCPIERPRSTTPINPSCLEDYCEDSMTAVSVEKLKISLPRDELTSASGRAKSPRRWTEFAPQDTTAPPLPPRGAPKDWINFEDIPERRKPPKRIQTIPSRGSLQPATGTAATSSSHTQEDANVIYNYVNPEDCKCECHEAAAAQVVVATTRTSSSARDDDELPLLMTDRRSDSSSTESQPPPSSSAKNKTTTTTSESVNAFPTTTASQSSSS